MIQQVQQTAGEDVVTVITVGCSLSFHASQSFPAVLCVCVCVCVPVVLESVCVLVCVCEGVATFFAP